MTADHDRDRDAGTGRFVTDDYAEQHPDTTVGEDVRLNAQPVHEHAQAVNLAQQLTEDAGLPLTVNAAGELVLSLAAARTIREHRAHLGIPETLHGVKVLAYYRAPE